MKEIANLTLPVFTLELAECTLESAVAIINAASGSLTTLIIHFSSVLLHYCLSCPPFVCPNLDTIQVESLFVFLKGIVPGKAFMIILITRISYLVMIILWKLPTVVQQNHETFPSYSRIGNYCD